MKYFVKKSKVKTIINENLKLKQDINSLNKQIQTLQNSTKKITGPVIDDAQITKTATKLVNNTELNFQFVPDFLKQRFYESVIRLFLALIKEMCDTTKIDILGHEIDIVLQKKTIKNE